MDLKGRERHCCGISSDWMALTRQTENYLEFMFIVLIGQALWTNCLPRDSKEGLSEQDHT